MGPPAFSICGLVVGLSESPQCAGVGHDHRVRGGHDLTVRVEARSPLFACNLPLPIFDLMGTLQAGRAAGDAAPKGDVSS